jgi:tetratricopeptide (TPR) repeat protein
MKFAACWVLAWPLAAQTAITFNQHVAPILFERCAPCHRPGESGPFALLTYADAKKRAAQIAEVTARRYMPPWPPEPGHGDFLGSRRLTDAQLRVIAEWAKQGAPEGPGTAPAPPKFTDGWQLGPPDLVLELARPYELPAAGGDVFRNFILPVPVDRLRYVRALELRPGNKQVVHHANILIDRTQSLRVRDGKDGAPGFAGMDVTTESRGFDPDSHFLFWKPGSAAVVEPEDMAWRVDPGTDLILNLHLQTSGKTETLRPVVGLYFTERAPSRFPMVVQLEHDGALDIPPGARDYVVTDWLRLPVAADVLGVYPHAHYVGKVIEGWAELPGGKRVELIRINDWDINWQAVYYYRRPLRLPAGAIVKMRYRYDNSAANPRNPAKPPQRVRSGNRSQDEMGHLWLQLLPVKDAADDPRMVLQEALARRRLEKYPADFLAHFNLGAVLEARGKFADAATWLQKAVAMEPRSATAHNSLGSVWLAQERWEAAIAEFRQAVQLGYPDARYNLARALGGKGDGRGAAQELEALLRERPGDAQAREDLGALYIALQDYPAALPHFEALARLRPTADLLTNLGTLYAALNRMPDAVAQWEQALRLDPQHQGARANLVRARGR